MSLSRTPVIMETVLESFPIQLRSHLRSRLLPEQGSRREIKQALFFLHDLYVSAFAIEKKISDEYLRLHFSALTPMPIFEIDKPVPLKLAYRKVYHTDGSSAVLFDRKKFIAMIHGA